MKLSRFGKSASLASAAIIAAPRLAHACAMCGLPGDHGIHAFNTSVLFMLIAPYVIFGSIVAIVFVSYRKAIKSRNAAAGAARKAPMLGASIDKGSDRHCRS